MVSPQSKAGKASASRLSPEERSARAAAGAQARWAKADPSRATLPRAICGSHDKPLKIGDTLIPCYVLEDETRVLTASGLSEGLGLARGGSMVAGMNRLELFASRKKINPFISNKLTERIQSPLVFLTPTGGKAYGYDAEVLVELCEAVLAAREAGALQKQQMRIAQQCEALTRGLARVGIVGLVDEATGYQKVRARNALEQILNQWLTKELQPWRKQFPDDYYRRIFELNGWEFDPTSVKRPGVIGTWTNDLVYDRLGPGLKEELEDYAGRDEEGRLKHHLHRHLTSSHGLPELQNHLAGVVALMKAATNWHQFKEMVRRAYPKPATTLSMAFDDLDQIGA
ncbi:P63C domain-containing protein [Qipengyuania sp. XHP0207]|uniref:P63C domain-containing protein n=1 Tax=Qipengyuania sp. XHP0207 TaxID=3038078 RepID=UPI0024200FD8|nr:P63C domain-containing protein [Qipengyuania sp. XHP0207]MDG5748556.1 P63C domain-containing protein [Qipengyuania sp. XHP0207]